MNRPLDCLTVLYRDPEIFAVSHQWGRELLKLQALGLITGTPPTITPAGLDMLKARGRAFKYVAGVLHEEPGNAKTVS